MIEETKNLIKNGNYQVIKEEQFNIPLTSIEIDITYQEIVSISIFEKYIIKLLDKAFKEKISFLETYEEEKIINIEKISNILCLDSEIIENNITKLLVAGLISIKDNGILHF